MQDRDPDCSREGRRPTARPTRVGEALFNLELASGAYSCARCHTLGWSYGQPGVSGQGAFGWNLTGGSVNNHFASRSPTSSSSSRTARCSASCTVATGKGTGRMPGFGNLLTDEQIDAILEYVRSL